MSSFGNRTLLGSPRASTRQEPIEPVSTGFPDDQLNVSASPFSLSIPTARVIALLESRHFDPVALMNLIAEQPRLSELLKMPAVREKHSVMEHTAMGLWEHQKYRGDRDDFPAQFGRVPFLLTFSLHDIGKGLAEHNRRLAGRSAPSEEHLYTLSILSALRNSLPLSATEFEVAKQLIAGYGHGEYLKKVIAKQPSAMDKTRLAVLYKQGRLTLEEMKRFVRGVALEDLETVRREAKTAARIMSGEADRIGLPALVLYDLRDIYYKMDILSYSWDTPRLSELHIGPRQHPRTLDWEALFAENRPEEVYAQLELLPCSPRAYPSLDWVCELSPTFDSQGDPKVERMFVPDDRNGMPRFSPAVRPATDILLDELIALAH